MTQSSRLGDSRIARFLCLLRESQKEQDPGQNALCIHMRVHSDLRDNRVVQGWIVKSQCIFQMRSGPHNSAHILEDSTTGQVTKNSARGVIVLKTEVQQIVGKRQRSIKLA